MTFQDEYTAWLHNALKDGVPDAVVAFTFNLFEQSKDGAPFGVEFVGAGEFDPYNSDWACDEVWEPPAGRRCDIPVAVSGRTWPECLERMKRLLASILSEETLVSRCLQSTRGVGVGFIDGDLSLLWAA